MKGSLSSLFILFQLIGFSLSGNNEKIIKFPFKKYFGGYYMQLKVGEPPQFIFHGIDQGLTVTWTDSMLFDINKSTTMKIIKEDGQLKFQQMRLYGKEIEDTVFFRLMKTIIIFYQIFLFMLSQVQEDIIVE